MLKTADPVQKMVCGLGLVEYYGSAIMCSKSSEAGQNVNKF